MNHFHKSIQRAAQINRSIQAFFSWLLFLALCLLFGAVVYLAIGFFTTCLGDDAVTPRQLTLADDYASVLKIRETKGTETTFCSGVCVSAGGVVLTAKHCSFGQTVAVEFPDGRKSAARKIHEPSAAEGAVAFQCMDDPPFRFSPIAAAVPQIGEPVYSWAYPANPHGETQLSRADGKVLGGQKMNFGGSPVNTNAVSFSTFHGASGGPVFNKAGHVVGLISAGNKESTNLISWSSLREAYQSTTRDDERRAEGGEQRAENAGDDRTTLIAFVTTSCPPCASFKADVAAGHYANVHVVLVEFDAGSRTWSRPEIAQDFSNMLAKSKQKSPGQNFPVFWIRGTNNFTVGYAGRSGLLQWLHGLAMLIKGLIAGTPPAAVVDFPEPDVPGKFDRDPVAAEPSVAGKVLDLEQRIAALANQFESSGAVGKALLIDDAIATAREAKSTAVAARDEFKTNPLHTLWGFVTLAIGLWRRRHSDMVTA